MYATDTILALKEPRPNDPENDEVFAYNKVRVVGESPVSHTSRGNWTGEDAKGVIITPIANFGGVLDEPFGKLRQMYDVAELPAPREIEVSTRVRVIDSSTAEAGLTPEQVFAQEAPGVPPEPGQVRGRTKPLGDDGGPVDFDGPLGPA